MKKLAATTHLTMPWKNGGGTTTEIARAPAPGPIAAPALDGFDWRVSLARIDVAGPFSRFAGVDRTLAVVRGAIRITIGGQGRAEIDLAEDGAPISFPGDVDVSATPIGGPAEDLNVMTRRGRFRHLVTRLRFPPDGAPMPVVPLGAVALLVITRGAVVARPRGPEAADVAPLSLAPRDALLLDAADAALLTPITPATPGDPLEVETEGLVVDLWPA